jgi:hypothetical protein
MTIVEQSNRLPIKQRPTLKLKFGPASHVNSPEAKSQTPAPEPVTATVKVEEAAPPQPTKPSSPELNEAERAGRASRTERQAAIATTRRILIKRWSNCFKGYMRPKKPIKVGIHRDIFAAAPELDAKTVKMTLRRYVSDASYRAALIEGAARYDLNGCPDGVVTEQQARDAAMKLGAPPFRRDLSAQGRHR